MQLHKQQDTRSAIQKMSRKELEYLARYENRTDIKDGMPAELMKRLFLDRPPSAIPRPMRPNLGSQARLNVPPYDTWVKVAFQNAPEVEQAPVEETDAISDLEKQWLAQQETDFNSLPFWKLKQECKARGIKFSRTDKKTDLLAKLNG